MLVSIIFVLDVLSLVNRTKFETQSTHLVLALYLRQFPQTLEVQPLF